MPLQPDRPGAEQYIRVSRLFVDSEECEGTVSDYRFALAEPIQDVVAVALTGYALPSSLAPSFLPGYNDGVHFELTDGGVTTAFAFSWPSRAYAYQNTTQPHLSYVVQLQQLLTDTVYSDPQFGDGRPHEARFAVFSDPFGRTFVGCSVQMRFLFAGREASAAAAMGFDAADTAFALETLSPRPTALEPFSRIFLRVDEVPEFAAALYSSGTATLANPASERVELLTEPVRKLTALTLRVRLEDDRPVLDAAANSHSLAFTVFSLAQEISVPQWARKQGFSI